MSSIYDFESYIAHCKWIKAQCHYKCNYNVIHQAY